MNEQPNFERGSDAKIEHDASLIWDSMLTEFTTLANGHGLGDEVQKICLESAHTFFTRHIEAQKEKAEHLSPVEWKTRAARSMFEAMHKLYTSPGATPTDTTKRMMALWKATFLENETR